MISPSRLPRPVVLWLLVAAAPVLSACSSFGEDEVFAFEEPETGIVYTPAITGAPSEEIAELMRQSLLVFRREEDGAQSLAFLRRRAEGDIETAQKILRSSGYYGATVTTRVSAIETGAGETDAAEDAEGDGASDAPGETTETEPAAAIAEIVIEPGEPFILERHEVVFTGPGADPAPEVATFASYGSPIGAPAEAEKILAAERQLVAALRGQGRAYAANEGRDALADRDEATLEIDTRIAPGPDYDFGPIRFEGAEGVERDYLLTYLPWTEGDTVDTALLAQYQRRLMGTRLFRSGRVTLPEEPPEGGVAPVTVTLEEAPPRTVKAGVRYNTDEGPGVRLGYEHRNLFGSNESYTGTIDASLDKQVFTNEFRKPQYLRPGQDLTAGLELRRVEEDAYDELGGTATVGLQRALGPKWTVGLGLLGEYSDITDEGETETAILGGVPGFVAYDGSDDLLDPTEGMRFRLDATPFAGSYRDTPVTFLRLDASGSVYQPLTSDGSVVLAGRARLGSILAGELDDVPPTRRLYSGGGGSVRGYAEKSIGPLDADEDPVGGRSVAELGAELRGKVWGDLALAGFVEAGSVSTTVAPEFQDGVQVAAGGGVRYHSPIGPIRLDVAVPVNPRDSDDAFQVYISIGQAF